MTIAVFKPSGTGLGLAIARRTVEAHGGRIVASNAAGHGITMHLQLPLERRAS